MTRLVIPSAETAAIRQRGIDAPVTQDQYLDRLAKYIPGEAVGVYTSLDGVVNPATRALDPGAPAAPAAVGVLTPFLPTAIFLVGLILAFAWIWYLGHNSGNSTWKSQAVIAAIAFSIWAYATKGAVFFQNPYLDQIAQKTLGVQSFYSPSGAMVLLIIFSALIAFYQPKGTASSA